MTQLLSRPPKSVTREDRIHQSLIARAKLKRFASVAVIVLAVFGGLASAYLLATRPKPAAPPLVVAPASSIADSFATDFVLTYLTTTKGNEASLGRFITLRSGSVELPTVQASATNAKTVLVSALPSPPGLSSWSVVVSVQVADTIGAPGTRRYFQVGVSVLDGAKPRALGLPATVPPPAMGVDLELGYPEQVDPTTSAYSTAVSFLTAFLTGRGDFSRYAAQDVGLAPLSPPPYRTVTKIVSINADKPVDKLVDGAVYRLQVTLSARSVSYSPFTMTYWLSLQKSGDALVVTKIDRGPVQTDKATLPTTTGQVPPGSIADSNDSSPTLAQTTYAVAPTTTDPAQPSGSAGATSTPGASPPATSGPTPPSSQTVAPMTTTPAR